MTMRSPSACCAYSPSLTPKLAPANMGPKPRVPVGGYLFHATTLRASSALWHMGVMMPCAPLSSARLTSASSALGMRTIGVAPYCATALASS